MEALVQAERELGDARRFLAGDTSPLSYSAAEEQALEEKVTARLAALQRALDAAQDWQAELADARQAQDAAQQLHTRRAQLQSLAASCRQALAAYRQRAKLQRLEQQRRRLLPASPRERQVKAAAGGAAVDVTAALRRTRQVMSQEIERVSSVTKVLDDGRLSLRSSHEEFGSVNAEIAEVRKRLKALEWQARQDKIWIGAGVMVLLSTVLFIVYERTGLIII